MNLSNLEIVVIALFRLGGHREPKDTEDIAVEANRLAPGRFVWRKYPKQISLEHVRVFLSDAKKLKNGRLASGDGTKGWGLTRAGLEFAMERVGQIPEALAARPRLSREELRRRRLESARVRDLSAWLKFRRGEGIKTREAEEVFRLSDYVRGDRRDLLVNRILNLFIDDSEIGPFVEKMAYLVREVENKND